MNLSFAFLLFTIFLGFIPLLLFLVKKCRFTKEIYYLNPMIWLMTVSSLYEIVGTMILKIDFELWFHLYLLLEFIVLYYFFFRLFEGKYKRSLNVFGIIFILTFIGLSFVWSESNSLTTDSYLSLLESLFVFTFIIFWFKDIFENLSVDSLFEYPVFYFISGLILYFSGTIFLFLLEGSILTDKEINLPDYWMLNVVMTFIFRILLIITIWKGRQK